MKTSHQINTQNLETFSQESVIASSTANDGKRLVLITVIENKQPVSHFAIFVGHNERKRIFKTDNIEKAIEAYNKLY